MTPMNFTMRIGLDAIIIGILVLRIHRASIYENGSFIRLALLWAFCWLVIIDVDNYSAMINFTGSPGSFLQGGVFRLIVILGIVIDAERYRRHRFDAGLTARVTGGLKQEVKAELKNEIDFKETLKEQIKTELKGEREFKDALKEEIKKELRVELTKEILK